MAILTEVPAAPARMAEAEHARWHSRLGGQVILPFGFAALATKAAGTRPDPSVPADVTRAKATAWLDLLSPLTEWAGLKGDELRHKRFQLRLQREDVLTRIAEKCTKRLGLRPPNSVPMPNKFLVPFLEQASLEDPDSSLVDMWANLFVSASENFESYHTHFVSIISRLSHKQAEIFAAIADADAESEHDLELSLDNIETYYRQHRIKRRIPALFKQLTAIPSSMDDFCQFIHDQMDLPGLAIFPIRLKQVGLR